MTELANVVKVLEDAKAASNKEAEAKRYFVESLIEGALSPLRKNLAQVTEETSQVTGELAKGLSKVREALSILEESSVKFNKSEEGKLGNRVNKYLKKLIGERN